MRTRTVTERKREPDCTVIFLRLLMRDAAFSDAEFYRVCHFDFRICIERERYADIIILGFIKQLIKRRTCQVIKGSRRSSKQLLSRPLPCLSPSKSKKWQIKVTSKPPSSLFIFQKSTLNLLILSTLLKWQKLQTFKRKTSLNASIGLLHVKLEFNNCFFFFFYYTRFLLFLTSCLTCHIKAAPGLSQQDIPLWSVEGTLLVCVCL